jgi:hypothetical protein
MEIPLSDANTTTPDGAPEQSQADGPLSKKALKRKMQEEARKVLVRCVY